MTVRFVRVSPSAGHRCSRGVRCRPMLVQVATHLGRSTQPMEHEDGGIRGPCVGKNALTSPLVVRPARDAHGYAKVLWSEGHRAQVEDQRR